MNIVVSNVRGPDVPIYLAGARMVAFAPVSIAMDGLGLNVTGFSYIGMLWMCSVACREMMPDPAFFADCLRSSLSELVTAAGALPEPAGAKGAGEPKRAGSPAKRKARRRPGPKRKTAAKTKTATSRRARASLKSA